VSDLDLAQAQMVLADLPFVVSADDDYPAVGYSVGDLLALAVAALSEIPDADWTADLTMAVRFIRSLHARTARG
jgi:hypothetical protein